MTLAKKFSKVFKEQGFGTALRVSFEWNLRKTRNVFKKIVWIIAYQLNLFIMTSFPKSKVDFIIDKLEHEGISIHPIKINIQEYLDFVSSADYSPNIYGKVLAEKSLEHFLSIKLLDFSKEDIFIDIASSNSPFAKIVKKLYGCKVYRQDIIYPTGIHDETIGSNAASIPLPDKSVTKMTLHCSFEHFERDYDKQFIIEADRLLKKGSKLCIIPLYLSQSYIILTDPFVDRKGILWDQGAKPVYLRGYGQRHGRFYNIEQLRERVLDNKKQLSFKLFLVENEKEVDPSCYVKFIALFEKK